MKRETLEETIAVARDSGRVTLAQIREWVSEAKAKTTFYPRTNETYYPASWSYGRGAGDASTSCHYDHRLSLAANHVAGALGVDVEYDLMDVTRARDAASVIAAALRAQRQADAAEDQTAQDPILVR